MAKNQIRDNAYYEERLQHEHPSVYADLRAGKYRTVTEATIAAGLKQVRTRLHELKNAWSKATSAEQAEFLRHLAGSGAVLPALHPAGTSAIAVNYRLTPFACQRLQHIMSKRHLKPGDVMFEMGYPRLNASVGM